MKSFLNLTAISIVALAMLVLISCGAPSPSTQEAIKIGVDLPTSVLPGLSASVQNGLIMAASEINDAGGIGGRSVDLVFYDDAFSPSMAVSNIARLIQDDKVVAVIGPADADSIEATVRLCQENKVIQVIATGAPGLIDPIKHPYLFRVGPTDADQAAILVSYATKHGREIAIVADDTLYGQQGTALLRDELDEQGKKPVVVETFSYGDTDMAIQVGRVIDSGADEVILWGAGDEPAYVTKELRMRNWNGKIVGCAGLGLLDYREVAKGYTEGVVFLALGARGWAMDRRAQPYIFDQQHHVAFDSQKWMGWQERYWAILGEEYFWWGGDPSSKGHIVSADDALISNLNQFFSYSALYILREALEKAGDVTDGEKVRKALERTVVQGLWHHDFRFTPDCHDALNAEDLVLLEYRGNFVEPVPLSEY